MLYNYHTHTARCHHAEGADREYVEAAIKSRIKVLGFSDHSPYANLRKSPQKPYRIDLDQVENYVNSIRALKKEYEKDVEILLGFELEYYPEYHKKQIEYLKTFNYDYLVLGQHQLIKGEEYKVVYSNTPTYSLTEYVDVVIEALETGDFNLFAHPDIPTCYETKAKKECEYERLCKRAKQLNIPLELNLLGIREGRTYPSDDFFEVASKVGNDILIGYDAHSPSDFLDKYALPKALKIVEKYKLNLITEPFIK